MDLQNSENKKNNDTVLEGVEIMCRVFWGPDLESCRHMIEGNFFESFETILTKPEAKPSVILDNINSIINRFDTPQSLFHHLNECYVRLFVNNKEGITAPLYQSCYEFKNAPMMGESAVKMNKRFKSKGLSMENRVHEPPDHLAIELEYLFFLLQDSGVGLDENQNENQNKFVSNEAASFATETMLPWVTVFNQRLKSATEDCSFYALASGILVLLLSLISDK